MDVRVVYVGLMRDVEPFGPSLAQMVERLTVEAQRNYQLVTGSIPVARISFFAFFLSCIF